MTPPRQFYVFSWVSTSPFFSRRTSIFLVISFQPDLRRLPISFSPNSICTGYIAPGHRTSCSLQILGRPPVQSSWLHTKDVPEIVSSMTDAIVAQHKIHEQCLAIHSCGRKSYVQPRCEKSVCVCIGQREFERNSREIKRRLMSIHTNRIFARPISRSTIVRCRFG